MRLISKHSHYSDYAARIGGEEFLVVQNKPQQAADTLYPEKKFGRKNVQICSPPNTSASAGNNKHCD